MTDYGLSTAAAAVADAYPGWVPGRVVSQYRELYRVACGGEEFLAQVSGKFQYAAQTAADFPAVGDFVLLDREHDGEGRGVIQRLLPRKSLFVRRAAGSAQVEQVVAANVDTVFICMSLNNDFNLRRLERYLALCWDSGAVPVVVLTKSDLCGDEEQSLTAARQAAPGVTVLTVSSLSSQGWSRLQPYLLPGRTVALIGSSGVGKSTLINCWLGQARLEVNGLRNDDRGRHTTTRRELLVLPNGCFVMDTPGMRELGLAAAESGLDQAFAEVKDLADRCRFANCRHGNEPGCAVRAALAAGELSQERWLAYQKLARESDFSDDKGDYLNRKEQIFKTIAKINKAKYK